MNQSDSMPHTLPSDMKKVFDGNTLLKSHWESLTPKAQNEWICWVITCAKQETRDKHIVRMQEDMAKGKRRPCCWPGCPHRDRDTAKWFNESALKAAKAQMNN